MRNCIRMVILPTLCVFAIICTGFVCSAERVNQYEYIEMQPTLKAEPIDPIVIISEQPLEETVSAVEIEEYVEDTLLPQEDIELIALVTMAEAEGECEEGKRLVIDTILNRVDSVYFPDTVHGVIYQANQFSSMRNGRVDKCFVDDNPYFSKAYPRKIEFYSADVFLLHSYRTSVNMYSIHKSSCDLCAFQRIIVISHG